MYQKLNDWIKESTEASDSSGQSNIVAEVPEETNKFSRSPVEDHENMYDAVIREAQNRTLQKMQETVDWRTNRQQELKDLAQEADLADDRRRNRKSRKKENIAI